jgi:hypothetical protein
MTEWHSAKTLCSVKMQASPPRFQRIHVQNHWEQGHGRVSRPPSHRPRQPSLVLRWWSVMAPYTVMHSAMIEL